MNLKVPFPHGTFYYHPPPKYLSLIKLSFRRSPRLRNPPYKPNLRYSKFPFLHYSITPPLKYLSFRPKGEIPHTSPAPPGQAPRPPCHSLLVTCHSFPLRPYFFIPLLNGYRRQSLHSVIKAINKS